MKNTNCRVLEVELVEELDEPNEKFSQRFVVGGYKIWLKP